MGISNRVAADFSLPRLKPCGYMVVRGAKFKATLQYMYTYPKHRAAAAKININTPQRKRYVAVDGELYFIIQ